MKIYFEPGFFWDHSAPTLQAELVLLDDFIHRYRVWCPHCRDWHNHGPRDGHREAHCHDPESPFHRTGYNVELNMESME